jgi:cytochrome c553
MFKSFFSTRKFSRINLIVTYVWRGLALAVVIGIAACSSEKTKETEATFDSIYSSYLKSCADCHTAGSTAERDDVPGLDMTTADTAYQSLAKYVNLPRRNGCNNLKYVVAGKPEQSFLLAIMDRETNEKFLDAASTECAPAKHTSNLGGPANTPSAATISSIKTWITNGAKR